MKTMTGVAQYKTRIHLSLKHLWRFLVLLFSQFYRDHCIQIGAALTYTTLLAFIPMLAVAFSIINSLTIYPDLLQTTQNFIIDTFTPGVGEELRAYILRFISNSAKVSGIGFVIFIFVALMTLNTIDKTLNRIWKVTNRRHTIFSLFVYIVVMFVGPLLIGISLAVSTYLASIPTISDALTQTNWLKGVPLITTLMAFSAIYRWVPNIHVAWRYAFPGGVVAAVLFELAKHGFTTYINWFPNYEMVYGALAVIPLTLVWIYLSWLIILVGAETTHCLAIYRHAAQARTKLLLTMYHLLIDIYLSGEKGLEVGTAVQASKKELRQVMYVLQQLHERGLVSMESGRCQATDKLTELGFIEVYDVLAEYTHTGGISVNNRV